jgi:hypothetical protein
MGHDPDIHVAPASSLTTAAFRTWDLMGGKPVTELVGSGVRKPLPHQRAQADGLHLRPN